MQKIKALFRKRVWRSHIRKLWVFLAVLLVVFAIIFTFFRALTPWVKQYRSQIQTNLSLWAGQKIHIKDLETSWYWFTPVLRLDEVEIQDAQHQVLHLKQVLVGINLWQSLWHWHIQPGVLYVDDAHFKIQQQGHVWTIAGINTLRTGQTQIQAQSNIETVLALLISQDKLIIKHVSADIELEDGTKFPIQSINLKANHRSNAYRLFAKVVMAQASQTSLTLIANLNVNAENPLNPSGQVYVALENANIQQWRPLFPKTFNYLTAGEGGLEAWLDLMHGHIKHVQSLVAFTDLRINFPQNKVHDLEFLTCNLSWRHFNHGWRLSVDQLAFNMDSIDWPENALILEYKKAKEQFQLYVKSIPLSSFLNTKIDWPDSFKPIRDLIPTGELHDTQLFWHQGEIDSFLTRFSHLSWQNKEQIPGLTNLYGALYWQPSEGHLELDGDHSVLTFNNQQPLNFDILNMALDWKDLSQGLRVSLDRLVLSHPNLILSAKGVIDDPMENAYLRLKADFAAKEAQFWLPYIPSKGLKPKLDEWLKQDIPHIGHASGRVLISGPWADFPFDNQNGDFLIRSHVSDADILINEEWPINRHVNADINVDKRRLTANIDQADLMGVPVHAVSIVVPDIGLGKELFLLHGTVDALGQQIKSYVFASPLSKRLARWQGLNIEDKLGLDLNLEVPLYPESDHVYAKGYLKFKNNPVSVEVLEKPAYFEDVKGKLKFNEYGLTDGGLDGILEGYPFTLRVQPLIKNKLGTELRFEGDVAIDYLQKLVPHPAFSLMKGRLILTGLWTVYPNETEIDKLYINSSLIGMALDLPPPLGKSISEIAPITININFHPQRRMDLEIDYAQRLKSKINIIEQPQHVWTTTGDIHLGPGAMTRSSKKGLRLSGGVDYIDMNEWQQVWHKWSKEENSPSVLDSLQDIDLHVNTLKLLGVNYKNLEFKAHYIKPKEWSFQVEQAMMTGSFTYNWIKKSISGHIDHLNIESKSPMATTGTKWQPKMTDIPNLDLSIQNVIYNGMDIGAVDINTSTTSKGWLLNACTIQTPEYQLNMQGEWTQKDKRHESTIEAQLYIKNLAKSLDRWHITPAIDVHTGQMKMNGKWLGPFYAFSLKKLVGRMQLTLKDGRISHLDRETEEKLGLGKLLSILSLQTIPRRLKLDFSDLSHQGYSFDVFKGNFEIQNGVMSTSDSYIDGPVAYGQIKGDLDLINQLYDVDLRISPYITASLPVVATIAGGPVAGLATWAISSLASKGMQKISGYSYKISGPWLNPVVQQVSIDKSMH